MTRPTPDLPHRLQVPTADGTLLIETATAELLEEAVEEYDAKLAELRSTSDTIWEHMQAGGMTRLHQRRKGPLDVTTMRGDAMRPTLRVGRAQLYLGTRTHAVLLTRHRGARQIGILVYSQA